MKAVKFIIVCFGLAGVSGCIVGRGISVMSTPSASEKVVEAEYDLSEKDEAKILVIVDKPVWVSANRNVGLEFTEAIIEDMVENEVSDKGRIVSYRELAVTRSRDEGFGRLLPSEAGERFDADYVLDVEVDDFVLKTVYNKDYYRAFMSYSARLFDVKSGEKVWPAEEDARILRVGFEIETGGADKAAERLFRAGAHTVVRYLYDCKYLKFKIREEQVDPQWGGGF